MLSLNNQPLNVTVFPDKTSQVWHLPEHTFTSPTAFILWQFENEAEIMHLAQLQMLLRNHGIRTTLSIPFLPYARQDKRISNESTFALHALFRILNSLNFERLVIMDPHNFEAIRLMSTCGLDCVYPDEALNDAVESTKSSLVCYPDRGAFNKYSKLYGYNFIYGEKVRDQATGHILSYEVFGDPKGQNVLIVDDICDGGATFTILAKDLLARGATGVSLFVSHGIFSKGLKPLLDAGIQRIFTKDGEAVDDQGSITYRNII